MGTIIICILICAFIVTICLWIQGIDYMIKNHPDYKGEDLISKDDDEIESYYKQMDKEVHQNNGNINK